MIGGVLCARACAHMLKPDAGPLRPPRLGQCIGGPITLGEKLSKYDLYLLHCDMTWTMHRCVRVVAWVEALKPCCNQKAHTAACSSMAGQQFGCGARDHDVYWSATHV